MSWTPVTGPSSDWDSLDLDTSKTLLVTKNGDYIVTKDGYYIQIGVGGSDGNWTNIAGTSSGWTPIVGP